MLKKLSSRAGQTLVLMAIALPSLLGAMALAIDVWNLYVNWTHLQTGADAAVLAGANYLPTYPDQAISTAETYAQNNKILAGEIVSTTLSDDNLEITMKVTRTVPYTFGRVLGLTAAPVSAQATAAIKTVPQGTPNGVTPVGIQYDTPYSFGQTMTLKMGTGQSWTWGPGNWGPLNMGIPLGTMGGGANLYRTNVEVGYKGTVNVGDLVPTEPGNMKGPTIDAFDYLLNAGANAFPSANVTTHTPNDPRLITVPMVDFSQAQGSSPVPVEGFAQLWLTGIDNKGNVTCSFVQPTTLSDGDDDGGGEPNPSFYTRVLIR